MNVCKGHVIVPLAFFAAFCCHLVVSDSQLDTPNGGRFFVNLLHALIAWQRLDPMKLPDQEIKVPPLGKAYLLDGVLSGLSTVFQTGPVVFSAGDEGVSATVNLGLGYTQAEFKIRLNGKAWYRHLIQLRAIVPSSKFWLEVKENTRAKLKLVGFKIHFPDGIKVHLRAVNPKDKFLDSILKTLTNILKPQMPKIAEKILYSEVENALKKLNRFVETGKFEFSSRRRRRYI